MWWQYGDVISKLGTYTHEYTEYNIIFLLISIWLRISLIKWWVSCTTHVSFYFPQINFSSRGDTIQKATTQLLRSSVYTCMLNDKHLFTNSLYWQRAFRWKKLFFKVNLKSYDKQKKNRNSDFVVVVKSFFLNFALCSETYILQKEQGKTENKFSREKMNWRFIRVKEKYQNVTIQWDDLRQFHTSSKNKSDRFFIARREFFFDFHFHLFRSERTDVHAENPMRTQTHIQTQKVREIRRKENRFSVNGGDRKFVPSVIREFFLKSDAPRSAYLLQFVQQNKSN